MSYENEIHEKMKMQYDQLRSQNEYDNEEHNFSMVIKNKNTRGVT